MTGKMRWAYVATAWLFLGSVLLQVFLAGLALFAGTGFELHRIYGSGLVTLIALSQIFVAVGAKAGGRNIRQAALLFLLVMIQGGLPVLRDAMPVVAAIHPMNALLIFWLGVHIARQADALRRLPIAAELSRVADGLPAQP